MEKKIENITRSVGVFYVGDWLIDLYDDNKLKKEIHKKADYKLKSIVNNNTSLLNFDKIIIVSLIIIAMETYNGSFYKHLIDYYPNTYKVDVSSQSINNKIREMIRLTFNVDENENYRLINHILIQTFVPTNYLGNFFEFIFDIFKFNYDYSIFNSENLEEEYQEVFQELKEVFTVLFINKLDESVEYKIDFDNNYRSYKLITSTRMALSNSDFVDAAIPIVINILKIINASFYGTNANEFLYNEYYKIGYEDWKKLTKIDIKKEREITENSINKNVLKPYIESFDYQRKSILIQTRRHNISDYKKGDRFFFLVLNNNEVILESDDLIIKEVLGGVKIEPKSIEIESFLGSLEYKMFKNKQCIYSSRDILNTDILVFDNQGHYLKRRDEYTGNVFIVTKRRLRNPNFDFEKLSIGNLYMGYKGFDTKLDFGSLKLMFEENIKDEIKGSLIPNLDCINENGQKFNVYSSLKRITIEASNKEKEKLFIRANNKNYFIPNDEISIVKSGKKSYIVIDIDFINLSSDFYNLQVIAGALGLVSEYSFMLDKGAKYVEKFDGEGNFMQIVFSDFFNFHSCFQALIDLKTEPIEYLEKIFSINNQCYTYSVNINLLHYKLEYDSYYYKRSVWFDRVKDKISIKNSNFSSIDFIINNKIVARDSVDENIGYIQVNRSTLADIFLKTDASWVDIHLTGNMATPNIIKVLNHNVLDEKLTNIFIVNGEYFLDVHYEGENRLNILLKDDNIIIFDQMVNDTGPIKLPIKKDINYKVLITEGDDNPFEKFKLRTLMEFNYYHLSIKELLKQQFWIKSIYKTPEGNRCELVNSYIDRLFYDKDLYGCIYFLGKNGKNYMHKLNPVKIEFLDEVICTGSSLDNNIFDAYIVDSDQDGILYLEFRKHLSYTGEEKCLPAVDRFELVMRGKC